METLSGVTDSIAYIYVLDVSWWQMQIIAFFPKIIKVVFF